MYILYAHGLWSTMWIIKNRPLEVHYLRVMYVSTHNGQSIDDIWLHKLKALCVCVCVGIIKHKGKGM